MSSIGIVIGNGIISLGSCLIFTIIKTIQLMRDQASFNNHEYMYIGVSMLLTLTDNHRLAIFHQATSILHISLLASVMYLMCCNGIYGIAGSIAYIGMIPTWCSLALILGRDTAIVGPENREAAPRLCLIGSFPLLENTTVAFTP